MNEKEFNRNCDGTDYGNWVPLNMMKAMGGLTGMLALAEILVTALVKNRMLSILLGGVTGALLLLWLYMLKFRALFDFKRGGLMGRIHQYLADHLDWDGRGKLLDIGCGAGALTNRCAKLFPCAELTGMDYWGAEWSYAKDQCEKNARAEGVADRVKFQKGDAAHLDFPDGTFDAAVSNFVFHEVRSEKDKRKIVREALRVVKKGGSFAFQDLFSQEKLYGDMNEFVEELKAEGIAEVHYIPHVEKQGFIPRFVQAPWMLSGVGLLYGKV